MNDISKCEGLTCLCCKYPSSFSAHESSLISFVCDVPHVYFRSEMWWAIWLQENLCDLCHLILSEDRMLVCGEIGVIISQAVGVKLYAWPTKRMLVKSIKCSTWTYRISLSEMISWYCSTKPYRPIKINQKQESLWPITRKWMNKMIKPVIAGFIQ